MTITQTVDIPANRRVFIDIPREVTADKARVIVQFPAKKAVSPTSATQSEEPPQMHIPRDSEGKLLLTKEIIGELLQDDDLRFLTGILQTDMTIDEIRMARLAKHL